MYQNKMFFMFLIVCWSCLMTVSSVTTPKGPLRSHITGGYKSRFIFDHSIERDLSCVFQVPKPGTADLIWTAVSSAVIMTFCITSPF
jgi:hypothetical protein